MYIIYIYIYIIIHIIYNIYIIYRITHGHKIQIRTRTSNADSRETDLTTS